MKQDEVWMSRAIELAEKARGKTSPNPLVGAVLVRGTKKISEGYHPYYGGSHAEIIALQKAGKKVKGSILYVTLEPCSSWGKTPPCVETLLTSGIKRMVIGSLDPNPKNHSMGIQRLKKAGISVRAGLLKDKVEIQNQFFFKAMRTGFPFVTLKMAQSLDGKIATRKGESRWISSAPARQLVHELRSQADGVLVGKNTALLDNPMLQGVNGRADKPWRIVIDPDLQISSRARIFQGPQLTFEVISEKKIKQIAKRPLKKGRILLPVRLHKGKIDLKALLKALVPLGVHHLLVEGGGEIAWSFLSEGLVDRLIWIVAPKIIGGRDAKTSVEGEGIENLQKAIGLKWEKVYRLGPDWVFESRVN